MITFALLTLEVYDNVFVGIEIDFKGFQSRNCNINVFNKLWIQLIKAVVSHLNNYLTILPSSSPIWIVKNSWNVVTCTLVSDIPTYQVWYIVISEIFCVLFPIALFKAMPKLLDLGEFLSYLNLGYFQG